MESARLWEWEKAVLIRSWRGGIRPAEEREWEA
jgi:hypothetical protein